MNQITFPLILNPGPRDHEQIELYSNNNNNDDEGDDNDRDNDNDNDNDDDEDDEYVPGNPVQRIEQVEQVLPSSKPARKPKTVFTYKESKAIHFGVINNSKKWGTILERNQNALRDKTAAQIKQRYRTMIKNNWQPNDGSDESDEEGDE
jgi:hypothetical protein